MSPFPCPAWRGMICIWPSPLALTLGGQETQQDNVWGQWDDDTLGKAAPNFSSETNQTNIWRLGSNCILQLTVAAWKKNRGDIPIQDSMQTHSNSLARLRTMFPSRHVRTTQVFPCTSSCCDSVGSTSLTTTHKKHMQKHDLPADFLTPKLVWELRFWNHGEWNQLQIKPVKHGCYYRILQVLRMGSTLIINSWRTIPASHPTWSSQHIVVIHINLSDWKKLETTDFMPRFL